jgi:hypothetical protein
MTTAIEEINSEVLQVHRDSQARLQEDIISWRESWTKEHKSHAETRNQLLRATASLVLSYKNLSRAGKKGRLVSGEIISLLNQMLPNRPKELAYITPQDKEWAEAVLEKL